MLKNPQAVFVLRLRRGSGVISLLLVSTSCLLSISAAAQETAKDIVQTRFERFSQNNFQEKVFVHTDKSNYMPGEICWFKIYNVDGYLHQPLDFEKCAYVEILDRQNKAMLHAKVPLQKGFGDGSLLLPSTLASGTYKFRAYTSWMKNYAPGFYFEKMISVINAQSMPAGPKPGRSVATEISFYPEGGNLVNGIQSRVAYKLLDQFGRGLFAGGVVLDQHNDTIAKFHSSTSGIGSFYFTPAGGSVYRAFINTPGTGLVKILPAVNDHGYTMRLERSGNGKIRVTVQGSDKTSSPKIFLFAHTRNVVKAAVSSAMQQGSAEFVVDVDKLGDGVSHFTVFNELRQPVCERLFFKPATKGLSISAAADRPLYGIRKKIGLSITTRNEMGVNVGANLSMAVYRVDSASSGREEDIANYLLLRADLPGVSAFSGYPVQPADSSGGEMDNLLITEGWRRFNWDTVLSATKPVFRFLPEINGHIINGKVTALQPGLPLEGINGYLSAPGTRTQFQVSSADRDGNLRFEMRQFYAEGGIVAQIDPGLTKRYRLDITQPFSNAYSATALPLPLAERSDSGLLKSYIATQVQNAYLSEKLNVSLPMAWDTTAFYLRPDAVYLLDNYVRFTTIEEVLREYVLEVNVRRRNGHYHLPVFDENTRTIFDNAPLLLLDGIPVFDTDKLMAYDPLKIRKLEVVSRKYLLGNSSFEGIVNFTTYKGDAEGYEIDTAALVLDYEGLQLKREFYSPRYGTAELEAGRLPDFRELLYWSPELATGSDGKLAESFYSSDMAGNYVILVQGITADGRAGSAISRFRVEKP
jgi:hypothetical protein